MNQPQHLGEVYRQQQQDSQKAIDCYRQAVRIDPNDYEAYCDLSASLVVCGQYADAIAQGGKAVRLNPDEVLGLDNLAWLLATCPDPKFRDGPRAVILSEHACQLTHNEVPIPLCTLAAAYAEEGRFTNAIASATLSEQLASEQGMPALALQDLNTADFRVVLNQRSVSSKAGISVAWSFLQSGFQAGREPLAHLPACPETYFCWKVLLR